MPPLLYLPGARSYYALLFGPGSHRCIGETTESPVASSSDPRYVVDKQRKVQQLNAQVAISADEGVCGQHWRICWAATQSQATGGAAPAPAL